MIIETHTFQYYKKSFRADELDVLTYMQYLQDPTKTIEKILLKYNKVLPALSNEQFESFIKIIFTITEEKNASKIKPKELTKKEKEKINEDLLKTVKYQVLFLAKNLKQPIGEITQLSMRDFLFAQLELQNIMDPEKFVPFAERNKADKKALKEFSNKK